MRLLSPRRLLPLVVAFAALVTVAAPASPAFASNSYAFISVDVNTGQVGIVGCVGTRSSLVGLAMKDAGTAWALTSRNRLLTFAAANPGTILSEVAITGLARGERLLGIDVRPATGGLYALGRTNTLYLIDPATGAASAVGASFSPGLDGTSFGFDFNPTVDRIRVVSDQGQNLRLHPDTGQVVSVDKPLVYKDGDPNEGRRPRVGGAGYTNSVPNAASTQLFVIDSRLDAVALQAPPNDGVLGTTGELTINISGRTFGFDIVPSGPAYAIVRASGVC